MDVTFFMRITWFDCRLLAIPEDILLPVEEFSKFWQPDVSILKKKKYEKRKYRNNFKTPIYH